MRDVRGVRVVRGGLRTKFALMYKYVFGLSGLNRSNRSNEIIFHRFHMLVCPIVFIVHGSGGYTFCNIPDNQKIPNYKRYKHIQIISRKYCVVRSCKYFLGISPSEQIRVFR